MAGPEIRADIVDVYVFRRVGPVAVEFLQMRRAQGALTGTWHPVMGHCDGDETAAQTAVRELAEETSYSTARGLMGLWQIESLNSYFLASHNTIVLSPCFAAQVRPDVEPTLDASRDDYRWVKRDHLDRTFLWPGQRQAISQIMRDIVPTDSPVAAMLRIDLDGATPA